MKHLGRYFTFCLVLFWLPQLGRAALNLVFDYTYDSLGFFSSETASGQAARARLEQAAGFFENGFLDSLTAISPKGVNSWSAVFTRPDDGTSTSIANLKVDANQLYIFAGGRDLPGATLGQGGPGGYSASGTSGWLDTVKARGQAGALGEASLQTDFGPWGGTVVFDNATNWNLDAAAPAAGQIDFLSVAMHELAHVLGFGIANSFKNLATELHMFTGAVATALYGSNPPLESNDAHWLNGTLYEGQQTAMGPSITSGTRNLFTALDWAGMADLGWEVLPILIPEPATWVMVALLMAMLLRRRSLT